MAEVTAELLARRLVILRESIASVEEDRQAALSVLDETGARLNRLMGQVAETQFWQQVLAADGVTEGDE